MLNKLCLSLSLSHSCLCHVPKLYAIQALSFNLLSLFRLMYWHRYFTMTFCMISYLLLCTCQKWRNKDVHSKSHKQSEWVLSSILRIIMTGGWQNKNNIYNTFPYTDSIHKFVSLSDIHIYSMSHWINKKGTLLILGHDSASYAPWWYNAIMCIFFV